MAVLTRIATATARLRQWHGPLAAFTAASSMLAVGTLVAWIVDDRTLLGQPVWAKPLKFAISFALYSVALAWMISRLQRWRRAGWWAGTVLVVASVVELVIIVAQVVRGRASHFNVSTSLDATLFSAMGGLVAVIYLCTLVVAVGLLFTELGDRALTWAVRLGILIAVAGLSVGFLMLGTTPEQAQIEAVGGTLTTDGGHAVGVSDGGPGLPLLGWSTTGGDLRVGHFIGMHALQLLPLLALALGRVGGLSARSRVQAIWLAAWGYAGVVVLTVWQALRGQPLLAPDALTLAAAGALLLAVAVGAAAIARTRTAPSTTEVNA